MALAGHQLGFPILLDYIWPKVTALVPNRRSHDNVSIFLASGDLLPGLMLREPLSPNLTPPQSGKRRSQRHTTCLVFFFLTLLYYNTPRKILRSSIPFHFAHTVAS